MKADIIRITVKQQQHPSHDIAKHNIRVSIYFFLVTAMSAEPMCSSLYLLLEAGALSLFGYYLLATN